jgi:hypothetical protein
MRVAGSAGDEAEGLAELWANWGATPPVDAVTEAEPGTEPDAEPDIEAAADQALSPVDEWDDLRQVLAGDPGPVTDEVDDEDEDEVDPIDDVVAVDDDETDEIETWHEALAALTARVDELTEALEEERAERERLAGQLDTLAAELDAVLGEALADEREQRQGIEDALRQVQATLSDATAPAYDGPERRTAPERRVAGDRRRSGARRERPLRARDFAPQPEPEAADAPHVEEPDDIDHVEARPSEWRSRLHEVAGSVSAWSADDIDRLRVD